MPLSTRIAPHLPFLRRFSRTLIGSQKNGDHCVAAMLETLITDPGLFPAASSDRIALYKLFITQQKNTIVPSRDHDEAAQTATLSRMNILPRQAFLLIASEGFQPREVMEILDISERELSQLIGAASAEISRQDATRILIVEDEPLIAMDIEQIAESMGHEVVGIARTKSEAITLYERENPGMLLVDIQLADGSSGIDVASDILRSEQIPIIVITAFPERLLTGTRPEPTFLVNKPFNEDLLKAMISQALFFAEFSASKD